MRSNSTRIAGLVLTVLLGAFGTGVSISAESSTKDRPAAVAPGSEGGNDSADGRPGRELRSLSPIEVARKLNDAFAEVVEKVTPSVVVIRVTPADEFGKMPEKEMEKPQEEQKDSKRGKPGKKDGASNQEEKKSPKKNEENEGEDADSEDTEEREDDSFRRWFREQLEERRRRGPLQGHGSGVVVREDGYIVTNAHVVEGGGEVEVRFQDGRKFTAEIVGTDERSDIAVIKIDAHDLSAAPWADSGTTRVGEFAIAIGAPFELDYSVTFGHVSAKGRASILDVPLMDQDFMQTDASINPGNSGGPLINIDGEIIGINSVIRGIGTGIGFAVPSNLARGVSDQLIAKGRFSRSWFGISIAELEVYPRLVELAKRPEHGVVVSATLPEGPAAASDLTPGDIITAIDGEMIETVRQLQKVIRARHVGQEVKVQFLRIDGGGEPLRKTQVIRPGEWPEIEEPDNPPREDAGESEVEALGLAVRGLGAGTAKERGIKQGAGVMVTASMPATLAWYRRMGAGDIVTHIDGRPISSVAEFEKAATAGDFDKGVVVNFISNHPRQRGWNRLEVLRDISGELGAP